VASEISNVPVPSETQRYAFSDLSLLLITSTVSPTINEE